MKREEMKQTIEAIVTEAKGEIVSVEDASETIVKVFEKSLEESIGEATKMIPSLGKLLGGMKK